MENKIKFTKVKNNAKLHLLGNNAYTFSLPSGHTCPFAEKCLSKVTEKDGKLTLKDGDKTEFRCFAASMEVRTRTVYTNRWNNYNTLKGKSTEEMIKLLKEKMIEGATVYRLHIGGDFFHDNYFKAWLTIAQECKDVVFYAYTKSLIYLVKYKDVIPSNFRLTASRGGKLDHLIDEHNLKSAEVVYSVEEAEDKKLEIDHDDSHAYQGIKSFGLLIHGTQMANSMAAQSWQKIKGTVGGYSKKRQRI